MTEAQQLLKRVVNFSQPQPPIGQVLVLSAWDEKPSEEQQSRIRRAYEIPPMAPEFLWGVNTYDEACSARSLFMNDQLYGTDLIIVTSAYHQLRAFLTFVKVFQGTSVRIWNAPAPSGWEKLAEELDKIAEYQAKGHVATYREGLDHLDWRDSYNCVGAA